MNNKSYPYIVAWEKYMGAMDYYIEMQVQLAQQQDAPDRAVFRTNAGWVTVDSLPNPEVREFIEQQAEQVEGVAV